MEHTDGASPHRSYGGLEVRWGGRHRRIGAAIAVLAIAASSACATAPATGPGAAAVHAQVRSHFDAGLDLYGSGEYSLAADRFARGAEVASRYARIDDEAELRTAECTAWLRAGNVPALCRCTRRLETLQRRRGRSDPGVNTLIALGSLADRRGLPALRLPNTVRPLLGAVAAAPEVP